MDAMDMKNDTVEKAEEAQPKGAGNPASDASGTSVEEIAAERDRLIEEKSDLMDRLLRRQAEFENFRRRAERDRADLLEYANTDTVRAMLPILDDFERALKLECPDREYGRGMELIYQRLSDALKKLGLEPIETAGQKFDPHIHHAVEMVQTEEYEDHSILDEYQRGYNFRGRLLRPAMVKVAVRKS
jgi:molecular chaperone GrpE